MTSEIAAAEAPPGMHTFTLTDADGVDHVYYVQAHPAARGQTIMWRLMAMGSEPLVAFMGAFLDDGVDASVSAAEMAQAGRALRDTILQQAPAELIREILQHTLRDSKGIGLAGAKGDLAFHNAYTRNYWEMLQAVGEVVKYNRFFPQLDGLMEKVTARVAAMQAKKQAVEPSPPSSPSGTPDDSTTGSGTLPSPA